MEMTEEMHTINSQSINAANLPNEILLHIFTYVTCEDLWNCRDVCVSWNHAAMDTILWQAKLCELLGTLWSVISCDQKPQTAPDLSDPNLLHPCKIYRFLCNYVPSHLRAIGGPLENTTGDLLRRTQFHSRTFKPTIGDYILNWWNQVVRRFSLTTTRRAFRSTPQPYRYAVFGPGFDARATSRLFGKLVDVRTKSFEPLDMIPGRMGFGAGLTLRLYGQAQQAAYDSSLKPLHSVSPENYMARCTTVPNNTSPNRTPVSTPDMRSNGESETLSSSRNSLHRTFPVKKNPDQLPSMEDFVFDLHYLYAFHGRIVQKSNYQRERILSSRLFQHQETDDGLTDEELLNMLTVSDSMQDVVNGLNGMIYAVDASESMEQSSFLYHELHAVLRAFPSYIANSVPIVILYIMPKEEIPFESFAVSSMSRSNNSDCANRDSYSGADYTVSWRGSLLLPISCLRLFELSNPWRLQKCASNDIKAVIQSIMWLKSRSPLLRTQEDPTLIRSNSAV